MEQAANIPSLMATVHHSQTETLLWTLTLGSTTSHPMPFPETIIGRGHDNVGNFDDKGSGIVGFGGGAVSLVSQLSSSIGGKFSYCLVPLTSRDKNSSKLNFGSDTVVSGPGTVSTPLVPKISDTFHFLTLNVTPQTQKGSKHEKSI
nr:aspartic proteinase cdr1 [Quercus suber]